MGGEMLAEPDRLCALAVRVARHEGIAVTVGQIEQGDGEAAHRLDQPVARVLDPQPHRGLHLIVAAAAGMHPRPQLAQKPLDGRVHILVGGVGLELDALEGRADLLGNLGRDQPLAPEHAGMRGRRPEVERQQPPIDVERCGERQHIGVQAAREAPGPQSGGHAGAASLVGVPAPVAAAHVLVGSDHTWMKPAAAPCWKLSPCS